MQRQLPALVELQRNGQLHVDSIDVFCEKGVFDVDQSRSILEAGRRAGLRLNFHADELTPLGGAEVYIYIYYIYSKHVYAVAYSLCLSLSLLNGFSCKNIYFFKHACFSMYVFFYVCEKLYIWLAFEAVLVQSAV